MNTQIYEEASNWIVKHREGALDAQQKKRFDAWLRGSPQHVRAYLEMSSIWEDVSSLDPTWNVSADQLIARARAAENIVPLGESRSDELGEGRVDARYKRQIWYALAASVSLLTLGTWFYIQRNTYSTDVGEQRSIALNDGSTIELNSRSRVRVHFSNTERDVDLLDGQALFHVAKNPARPFVVRSDRMHVRAVGTEFDVYRKASGTVVTVVEGRVAVIPGAPTAGEHNEERARARTESFSSGLQGAEGVLASGRSEVLLIAGEQLMASQAAVTAPRHANVAAATAWTRRSLVFDSASLTEVAEEFNRYNTRQLVIENPHLADFRISGVFSSVDPALLLRFLRAQPDLVVEETNREIRIFKK